MRVEYDPEHDLMNIEFLQDAEVAESTEIDGIIFDYAKDHSIVAVEILDASKRISHSPLDRIDFAVTRG